MNWIEIGRFLIVAGAVLAVVGLIFLFADKLPLGRLPGDFRFGGGKVRFYFPLATCIMISVIITLIVNFFSRR
jgi:hypothetical protein